ncbi:RNA polymerase sigma factor [Nitrospirillum sp. BR 11752]|uniref:RNA polymerase sigma factor n=1 Tax=Nitrospirillum sp. BR 11752 TaxID=3104293 RepID=UPI002EC66633|nr:RNA polymerase sigma factor [Nitrospirillum sp. BR 11752]
MDSQADARTDSTPPSVFDSAELEAHQSALRGYFARRVRQAQDVDDYVQDVYLRALSAAPDRGVDNWRAFLLRVANNLLIDRFRRNTARHQDAHDGLEEVAELVDDGAATPERTLMFRQELACLEAALRDVDPLARHAFLLVRVDGLSHREVAGRLGLEVKTVSRQIERVLAHLARTLVEPSR